MSENDQVITEFRANAGRRRRAGARSICDLLLLHDVGRKSGREFVHPLLYLAHEDSYLILGRPVARLTSRPGSPTSTRCRR